MDLVEESQVSSPISLTSFIDSEFEEATGSPGKLSVNSNSRVNSYGRLSAAIFSTPRTSSTNQTPDDGSRHLPTHTPNFNPEASTFFPWKENAPSERDISGHTTENVDWTNVHVIPVYERGQNNAVANNMTPIVIQLPLRGAPNLFQRISVSRDFAVLIRFPSHVTHSPNVLLIPVN